MFKSILLSLSVALLTAFSTFAQQPQGAPPAGGFDPSKMLIGRVYGKVVDESGKGIGYATVQLFGKKFDPRTQTLVDTMWAGQLTEDNGDFNLEHLPIVGEFELVISFLGFTEIRQKVDFGIKPPQQQPGSRPAGPPAGGFPGAGMASGSFEKDLGNIRLVEETKTLSEVVVVGEAAQTTLSIDRKTYRVDKDLTTAGGTAVDALKNVPSLSVDLDGNVSLRNSAPQIFVDGRPTTLSLDQIPASDIERVEVITNPSAKFDAGGGAAGIVNIILKKERKMGYNGNVRLGGDSRGGLNFGGDINARQGKVNLFASGMYNQHSGTGEGLTLRQNFFEDPPSRITQLSENDMNGLFANARLGLDYFIDNRNTLTFSGMLMRGKFQPGDQITTTTEILQPGNTLSSSYLRTSDNDMNFRNLGGAVQFKHLFPKEGAEWTADLYYNRVRFEADRNYSTTYDNGLVNRERQLGVGTGQFITLQTDFINPIGDVLKLEGGLKATLRSNQNDNTNLTFSDSENVWVEVPQITDHYKFTDNVFAAYLQGSRQWGNWGIQAGLRAESSFYSGSLTDRDSSFTIAYPFSLFPSVFFTRKLNANGDQVQLSYTRRINRPNFFQTMPFTDFSDSLNLRRGNVHLEPEFTNSLELSYQKIFKSGHNVLLSVYYKQATNLIASYQFTEFNESVGKEVVITSYANGNDAAAYGAELTVKNSFFDWLELTHNLNIYQQEVDASNVESNLTTSRLSAFFKEVVQVKLPAGFALQLNGEFRTKTSFTPVTNNDPFSGGFRGQNTAQGYNKGYWFVDASVRKNLLKNQASLTLSLQDVFRSRKMGSYIGTDFFTQDNTRSMNPQTVRLNFSYRFGKMDMSLFRRKNNRVIIQGTDMM